MNKKEIIKVAENTLKRSKNIGSGKRLINLINFWHDREKYKIRTNNIRNKWGFTIDPTDINMRLYYEQMYTNKVKN